MPKVVLISQVPLPFSKIGSWTTLYKNYLQNDHKIDYIICELPDYQFENVGYSIVKNDFFTKIKKKIFSNKYIGYLNALHKILDPKQKYIIQVVDNFGLVKPLLAMLKANGFRENCYIQFFYHGFPPFYENFHGRWFFESINEMILLTNDSYIAHKNYYTVLPNRFSVLHNGIDTSKFYQISNQEKLQKNQEKGIADIKIFVWCSQDRPKKGLHLVLDAWKNIYKKQQNIELWVIGCEPKKPQNGVKFLGRISNDELPNYLQLSDCYLFPTLWHEGFGMTLIEALHCGNYCIASAIGGVPEVLQYGKFGKLIEKPHFVSEWEQAIQGFLDGNFVIPQFPSNLYTTKQWNQEMDTIIENAKSNLTIKP